MNAMSQIFEVIGFKMGASQGSMSHYLRGFDLHATDERMNEMMRATKGGSVINHATLGKASGMINMSSDATTQASMEGGWDAPRVVVWLLVKLNSTGSLFSLKGFTTPDFATSGMDGRPNGNAIIHFNSYAEFDELTDAQGNKMYRPVAAKQLLTQQYSNDQCGSIHYSRPENLLDWAAAYSAIQKTSVGANSTHGISAVNNVNPSEWLGKSGTAIVDAMGGSFLESSDITPVSTMQSAAHTLTGDSHQSLTFLNTLISGASGAQTQEISWNELVSKLPALSNYRCDNLVDAGGIQNSIPYEQWNSRDAMVYSELVNTVPALMEDLGILNVRFKVSNINNDFGSSDRPVMTFEVVDNNGGWGNGGDGSWGGTQTQQPDITFITSGMDVQTIMRAFEAKICGYVFPRICAGNKLEVIVDASTLTHMTMRCNINGMVTTHQAASWGSSTWGAMGTNENTRESLTKNMALLGERLVASGQSDSSWTGNGSTGSAHNSGFGGSWGTPSNGSNVPSWDSGGSNVPGWDQANNNSQPRGQSGNNSGFGFDDTDQVGVSDKSTSNWNF